jgi:hypothetical protein
MISTLVDWGKLAMRLLYERPARLLYLTHIAEEQVLDLRNLPVFLNLVTTRVTLARNFCCSILLYSTHVPE